MTGGFGGPLRLGIVLLLSSLVPVTGPATGQEGTSHDPLPLLDPAVPDGLDVPAGWRGVEIPGRDPTRYVPDRVDGSPAVRAVADGSASGLFRDVVFDPRRRPRLVWRWRIEAPVPQGDLDDEGSDDYAARLFVVFSDGGETRAEIDASSLRELPTLCYVWADREPATAGPFPSPYVDGVRMIVVRAGAAGAGRWLAEERDLVQDYRTAFGGEPGDVLAVGVMTDTDDTDSRIRAWYGAISALPAGTASRARPGKRSFVERMTTIMSVLFVFAYGPPVP